ncbi:MAG: GNAT family N-acetyltransferase [Microbacterium sp.]|uniref:GNAT family N-acetyltransferase n=1 Tax=Microbacterium sp. TaxID=51671 RepID=UPI003A8A001E
MLEEEYEKDRRRPPRHLRRVRPTEQPFSYSLRPVRESDTPDIREIYNHYVTNSSVTFDEQESTLAHWHEKRQRLHAAGLPFLVAESPTGQVLGYAYVQPWSSKTAYRFTVEDSIYLGQAAAGHGLGTALLAALVTACEESGIRTIIAVISDKGAEASIAVHRRLGFVETGRMGRVGFKFGRWLGVVNMQKTLTRRRR